MECLKIAIPKEKSEPVNPEKTQTKHTNTATSSLQRHGHAGRQSYRRKRDRRSRNPISHKTGEWRKRRCLLDPPHSLPPSCHSTANNPPHSFTGYLTVTNAAIMSKLLHLPPLAILVMAGVRCSAFVRPRPPSSLRPAPSHQ